MAQPRIPLLIVTALALTLFACSSSSTAPDGASGKDMVIDQASSNLAGDGPTGDLPTGDLPTGDLPTGDLSADAPTADMLLKPFSCGDTQTCKPGQYCQSVTPGVCGGTPMTDAGVCPPDCYNAGCPGGGNDCTCNMYSCGGLAPGCNDCSCITLSIPSCSCNKNAKGEIHVSCGMP